jgi:hypothetical protein
MAWATFNRFELRISKEDASSGSHQGQCDDDIAGLLTRPYIARQLDRIPATLIASELREYGAWDEAELADEAQNRARILWIACGDIQDNAP